MLDQRRLIMALASGAEPHQACRDEGITWQRFRRWLSEDAAFQKKYDELFGSNVGSARSLLDQMAVRATNVVADALEAEQTVYHEAVCPECDNIFDVEIDVANMENRKWAAKLVLQSDELLKDVRKSDVTVTHQLGDVERRIALQRAKRNLPIPEHLKQEFIDQGLLTEGETIEGEFREVEEPA